MVVVDHAVEHVEDIPADDGREGHAAPVGAEAVDAECFGDEGGEAAEEEAVGDASQAGNEEQEVGVLKGEGDDLGDEEYHCGDGQAPQSGGFKDFNEEIGAQTCNKVRFQNT